MRPSLRASDARTVHAWDGFIGFWVVLWLVIGVWTGVTLWQAADTGDTISASGDALQSAGGGLQGLAEIPIIGERPGTIGSEVAATGSEISERGTLIKTQLRRLAILLGLAIVAIPVMPVGGFYLPLRLSWRRRVRDLEATLAKRGEDPGLDRFLAEQARSSLSYAEVRELIGDDDPTGERGVRRLADAELSRLGVARPSSG